MDWKTQRSKAVSSPQINIQFYLKKSHKQFLYRQDYSKIHLERQRTTRAKASLKKMKGEESVYLVSRLKLQFKYTVVQYSWKDKHINQWKRVKSPEIDPHNNAQIIFFIVK